jgi:hypothetical protein
MNMGGKFGEEFVRLGLSMVVIRFTSDVFYSIVEKY